MHLCMFFLQARTDGIHYKPSNSMFPKYLDSLCNFPEWFVSYLVANPKDVFSHDVIHIMNE